MVWLTHTEQIGFDEQQEKKNSTRGKKKVTKKHHIQLSES